jgi:hypothetical protein
VVDANGNGKRDEFVGPEDPVDPSQDKWVAAAFYGVQPSPVDDSVWGQAMDVGFSRVDQPGFLIRLIPGANPPGDATLAESFQPPAGALGFARHRRGQPGGRVDRAFQRPSGQLRPSASAGGRSTDRRRNRRCLPGRLDLHRFPGPQFKGVDPWAGAADHAYYLWVDRFDTLGLGKHVPIAMTNGGEVDAGLAGNRSVNLRVPYPLGFFSENADGRIDDPSAGWKGRGLWTTSGTRTNFHGEGGRGRGTRRCSSSRCGPIRWPVDPATGGHEHECVACAAAALSVA